MKHQFLPKTPFQSHENRPEEAFPSATPQAVEAKTWSASTQQQEKPPTTAPQSASAIQHPTPTAMGKGLLSSWKSSQTSPTSLAGMAEKGLLSRWKSSQLPPPERNGNRSIPPTGIAEQETIEQPAVQRPITGPVGNSGLQDQDDGVAQVFASGQVAPHQSDMRPAAYSRSVQLQQSASSPPQPQPMARSAGSGGAPFSPVAPPSQLPQVPSVWQRLPAEQEQWNPGLRSDPGVGLASGPYTPTPGPLVISPQPLSTNKTHKKKKRRIPIWATVVLSIFLVLLVTAGGLGVYLYFYLIAPANSNILNQQVVRGKGEADPNLSRGNSSDILSGGRINILLLGSDTDQKFTNADGTHTYLAQTDIIVSIDPATQHVVMLSIPRDFWINVPGYGMHKLDEAFGLGNAANTPPGNVDLSRLTIQQDFGIPINYYAWVGLSGFVKVIDTVGGVDVDVTHPITDDNYPNDVGNNTTDIYAYKRLYIPAGPQHLSGVQALEYVRSRHADLVGDFGRSARQQQVLGDLKTKLTSLNITDINKLHELENDLIGYVKTDMGLTDIYKLVTFARSLDSSKIEHVTLGPPYSTTATLGTNSVVLPDCAKIVPVIAKVLALGNNAACNIQANNNGPFQSTLASTSHSSSSGVATASTQGSPPSSLETASQMASMGPLSLNGASDTTFGIHSLLDLLFLGVFESPAALQI